MAKIPIDLTKVETGTKVIPIGPYRLKCVKVDYHPSKTSGENCIYLDVIVNDGSPHQGHKMYVNLSLSEKALWKLREGADAFGVRYDQTGLDYLDFLGRECLGIVGTEDYNGKTKNVVSELGTLSPM